VLKVELVLELEDEELDYRVDELCVEDEFSVLLLIDDSAVVEVERLVGEVVEDEVCEVVPGLDALEV
jgi:hypothetical protein